MALVFPSADARARRLRWLAIGGAAMLLAGVLFLCRAAIRTSEWIVEATSSNPLAVENATAAGAERWFALVASIEREESIARIIAAAGTGALASSLFMLAVNVRWRFSLRTLLLATVYLAVLVGVPFGYVRPRLHNPRIFTGGSVVIGVGQLRPYANARYDHDPWSAQGPVSRGGGIIVNTAFIVVGLAALVLVPLLSCLPMMRPEANQLQHVADAGTRFGPG
jgi:hypothetical protein